MSNPSFVCEFAGRRLVNSDTLKEYLYCHLRRVFSKFTTNEATDNERQILDVWINRAVQHVSEQIPEMTAILEYDFTNGYGLRTAKLVPLFFINLEHGLGYLLTNYY